MNLGDFVFLKPCEERTVINPVTSRAIASEGEWLQLTVHLLRRVRLGDCVIVPEAVQPATPAERDNDSESIKGSGRIPD